MPPCFTKLLEIFFFTKKLFILLLKLLFTSKKIASKKCLFKASKYLQLCCLNQCY